MKTDMRPLFLLQLDFEIIGHEQFFEAFINQFQDEFRLIVATPNVSEFNATDFQVVEKGSKEAFSALLFADFVMSLDPTTKIYRYNDTQNIYSLLDFETFTKTGSPVSAPIKKSNTSDNYENRKRLQNFVYDAPEEDTSSVFGAKSVFTSEKDLVVASRSVFSMIKKDLKNRKVRSIDVLLFIQSPETILGFSPEFLEFFERCLATTSSQIVVVSNCAPELLARIPRTAHIRFSGFQKNMSETAVRPNTLIMFDELRMVRSSGMLKGEHRYLDLTNLNLVPAKLEVNSEILSALSKDPAEYYRNVLATVYVDQAVENTSASIIIPHYNTEIGKLLRCLKSALDCKRHHPNTEIILIDDGSKVDISDDLKSELGTDWDSVEYFRKENTGLGPTRNFGIEKSHADYVYFLDSDDEIVAENWKPLLSHGVLKKSAVVVGKRLLCDPEGSFISDSLNYVFRGVSRSATAEHIDVFDDQMANNKLILRSLFHSENLWFNPGLYEDNAFTAKLYNSVPEISFLNFPIHKWYQYGVGESITKTIDKRSIVGKIASLEDAWRYLDDDQRVRRIGYNVANDLRHYISASQDLELGDRIEIAQKARTYVEDRSQYLKQPGPKSSSNSFFKLLDNLEASDSAPTLSSKRDISRPRHVFFVRTHFHFLSAMAHTLEFGLRSILIFDEASPTFDPRFHQIVRRLGIFDEVRTYRNDAIFGAFANMIRHGSEAPQSVFDILFREFNSKFPDFTSDDIGVLFLDNLPERYFAGRVFGKVIKFEDGYHSINRELVLDTDNGVWGQVSKLCKRSYDTLHSTPQVISQLIISNEVDVSLLTEPYAKAEILRHDFKELAARHSEKMAAAMGKLYGRVKKLDFDTTLIITQPLYNNFCTLAEHLALVAHMVSLADTKHVVIKPHPSDNCDYAALGLPIIGAGVPFEYFEATNQRVKNAITFGSSALVGSKSVDEVRYLFKLEGFDTDDVKNAISEICYEKNSIELPGAIALIAKNADMVTAPIRRPAKFKFSGRTIAVAWRLLVSDWPRFKERLSNRLFK